MSELEPGQALLRVDTFGLTANNVTYAVFGDAMSYWDFFPAEDGWGRVPMWGFALLPRGHRGAADAASPAGGWLDVIRRQGFDGVRSAYLEVLAGRVDPTTAHVLSLR